MIRGRTLAFQMKAGPVNERFPSPEQVGNNISSCILEVLQRASKEKHAHEMRLGARQMNGLASGSASREFSIPLVSSQDHAEEIVQRLEVEINALESKLFQLSYIFSQKLEEPNSVDNAPSGVLFDLLSKRDRVKTLAVKSGLVLQISLGCKNEVDNKPQREAADVSEMQTNEGKGEEKTKQQLLLSLAHFQSLEAKHKLIPKIIGSPLLNAIASSISEVQSLQKKIRELHSETSCEQSILSSRQKSISSKRKEIVQRVDHLQQELKELEMQDQRLAKEEIDILSELRRLEILSEREIMVLNHKMSSNAGYLEVDREVKWTVERIGELEWAWICFFSSPHATLSKMSLTSLLPSKLDQYLHHAHSYFQTEVQSIEILRDRVFSMEADVLELESELQPCLALGMSTNVELITHDLMMLKSRVNEDNIVIDALKKDMSEMRLDLIRRVEDFCWSMMRGEQGLDTTMRIDIETLRPSHMTVLEEISLELTGVETNLDLDDEMGFIFSRKRMIRPTHSRPNSSATGTKALSAELPSTPLVMPKFSWANQTNNTLKKETRSFLDIQREEISLRERDDSHTK